MRKLIPDSSRVGIVKRVSNFGAHQQKYPTDEIITRDMARQLGYMLAKQHVKKTVDKFSTEYRLDLVVLTTDEFMGVVQQYAQEMYCRPMLSLDEQE